MPIFQWALLKVNSNLDFIILKLANLPSMFYQSYVLYYEGNLFYLKHHIQKVNRWWNWCFYFLNYGNNRTSHILQNVWRCYKCCCEAASSTVTVQAAAYRTFCRYWLELLPYIVVSKPRSDLCWVCHQHSTNLSKLSNKPDDEKIKVVIEDTILVLMYIICLLE